MNPETSGKHEKHTERKRKSSHLMTKLIGGWMLLIVLIVFGAKTLWPDKPPVVETNSNPESTPTSNSRELSHQLNQALPEIGRTLTSFLAASGTEERNQFVLNPIATASRMARFASQNPHISVDPQTILADGNTLLLTPGETPVIETHWIVEDGRTFDACFREEDGQWRLDWDHFARFSDYPWALFLAGSGPDEGEFRLLARERLAKERATEPSISIVLYAPRFGHPNETGFQSPEFLVSRSTRNGQLLDAAFKLSRENKRVFQSKLPDLNPDDMIRVRVKVRRDESGMQRRFEITEVLACHWMSIDEPGVEAGVEPAATETGIQEP